MLDFWWNYNIHSIHCQLSQRSHYKRFYRKSLNLFASKFKSSFFRRMTIILSRGGKREMPFNKSVTIVLNGPNSKRVVHNGYACSCKEELQLYYMHVARMESASPTRNVYDGDYYGRCRQGIPRLQLIDHLVDYVKTLDIKNWRQYYTHDWSA